MDSNCGVIEDCYSGVVGGEENEQMGVGQYWVRFDVEKECDGEEDEVLWPLRRLKKQHEKNSQKIDAGEDGRQAAKGQTSNDQVPGFERMDRAGHCCSLLHHNWRPIGKDG